MPIVFVNLAGFHRFHFYFQNVLLRKVGEEDYMAIVADFGLAAKIPHPE